MKLVINEKQKKIAESLIDPTSFETIFRYVANRTSQLDYIVVIQDEYDMAEVVSPLMVHNDAIDEISSIDGKSPEEYLHQLLKEKVIRMIVPKGAKQHMKVKELMPYVDEPQDYDTTDAVMCIQLPPIYVVKPMGKKWE
jgi:hypothetical protein